MSFDSKSLSSDVDLPEICSYLLYGLLGHEELKKQKTEILNKKKEKLRFNNYCSEYYYY